MPRRPDRSSGRVRRLSVAGGVGLGSAGALLFIHGIHAAVVLAAGPAVAAAVEFACRIH